MASESRLREVCRRYGLKVNVYEFKRVLVQSNSTRRYFIEDLDWLSLTEEESEEIAVSWSLRLSFEDNPTYHTNLCQEIFLPDGPKTCTL
jgi:hypothetical protein